MHYVLISLLLFLCGSTLSYSQRDSTKTENLFDLNLEELLNTKITVASKVELTAQESPAIVSVISQEEISSSGARDLIDVLRLVPGIDFNVDTWGVVGISMRGNWGNNGKVLLMIDGQAQNEIAFSALCFGNHYPVGIIKRIEIIRGPGSAVYGGYAELGVINIITNKGEDLKGIKIAGNTGFTSSSKRWNTQLSVGTKVKNLDLWGNAFLGNGNRSDRTAYDFYGDSYSMKDASKLTPTFINSGIKYKGFAAHVIYDDFNATSQDGAYEVLLDDYKVKFKTLTSELSYIHKISDKLSLQPKFNLIHSQPWMGIDEALPEEKDSYSKYYRILNRYKGGISFTYDPTEKINILAGVEHFSDVARDLLGEYTFRNGEYKISYNTLSLYSQAMFRLPWATMTIGGRVENHSQYGLAFAPRVGVTKNIKNTHLKLLYNRAFRSPSIEEIDYNTYLNPPTFQPTIVPEKTQVAEFEVGQKVSKDISLTANLFYININKAILWIVNTDGISGYDNSSQTGTIGFDIALRVQKKWGVINANYSYNSAKGMNHVEDYAVPNFSNAMLGQANHRANLSSSIKLLKNLSLNPTVSFYGERRAYVSYDENIDDLVVGTYTPQALINIFLQYKNIFSKSVTVGAGVYNLTNTSFDFLAPYNSYHAALPSQTREFILRFSYQFKK